MRILAISDTEAKYYYDFYTPGRLDEFDLILSCGDLKAKYLEFLATLSHCPVLYVRGNHDDRFSVSPPEGCICIENRFLSTKESEYLVWVALTDIMQVIICIPKNR